MWIKIIYIFKNIWQLSIPKTTKQVKVKFAQSGLTLCNQNSPGQNTGLGSLSLLQGIFPIQIEPRSPTLQPDSLPAEPQGWLLSNWDIRWTKLYPEKKTVLETKMWCLKTQVLLLLWVKIMFWGRSVLDV